MNRYEVWNPQIIKFMTVLPCFHPLRKHKTFKGDTQNYQNSEKLVWKEIRKKSWKLNEESMQQLLLFDASGPRLALYAWLILYFSPLPTKIKIDTKRELESTKVMLSDQKSPLGLPFWSLVRGMMFGAAWSSQETCQRIDQNWPGGQPPSSGSSRRVLVHSRSLAPQLLDSWLSAWRFDLRSARIWLDWGSSLQAEGQGSKTWRGRDL